MPPLWLIGMMGAGKSSVGAMVASMRGIDHVDIDQRVAQAAGRTIAEIFETEGEEGFRARERSAVEQIAGIDDVVVSTGGGVVTDDRNIAHMRGTGAVVLLEASIDALSTRVPSGANRPMIGEREPRERMAELWNQRREWYEAAAHYVIDAEEAVGGVADLVAGCAKFDINEESTVLMGPGLPRKLLPNSPNRQQAVVVCQDGSLGVARSVMARLESEVDSVALVELADGEDAKTLESTGLVYDRLAELNLGRHDTIVGVGGGTVTDVAGFVAATWLRGVESVAIPTTMLGAVDAAIGGKTGINVQGKNLVGAFWHPRQVAISLGVLDALDEELKRQGAAEAIKAGFIADPTIVDLYQRHGLDAPNSEIVRRAVAVKVGIVAEDFREHGSRALLNFGHTIGHGIESATGMPHGHAVSIGMVAAGAISQDRFGLDASKITDALAALGLPTEVEGADHARISEFVARDKKRTAGGLRMVLLRAMADPVVEPVEDRQLSLGLAAVGVR